MSSIFIDHYGHDNQLKQLSKECIELAHAINDYLDDKDTLEHVKEEMADNLNLIQQFDEHWGGGELFKWVKYKRERQMSRIREEQAKNG